MDTQKWYLLLPQVSVTHLSGYIQSKVRKPDRPDCLPKISGPLAISTLLAALAPLPGKNRIMPLAFAIKSDSPVRRTQEILWWSLKIIIEFIV